MFPDATNLISFMLRRMDTLVQNLYVNKDKMSENINNTNGAVFSQRVMLMLISTKNIVRSEAYEYMKEMVNIAYDGKVNLREVILKDNKYNLTEKEIDSCFELEYYYKNMEIVFKRMKV
jgi:adenylosuccinate lyase